MKGTKIVTALALVPIALIVIVIATVKERLVPSHVEPPHFIMREYVKAPLSFIKGRLFYKRLKPSTLSFSTDFQPILIPGSKNKK